MQLVIFDLDGVIVSTDEFHYKAAGMFAVGVGQQEFELADYIVSDLSNEKYESIMEKVYRRS